MEGKCNFQGLIRHFCWVNDATSDDFYQHYLIEKAKWDDRSQHQWNQDLKYIIEYPLELF
jgi:hypothetical protein